MDNNSRDVVTFPIRDFRKFKQIFRILVCDLNNRVKYGPEAPKCHERIWVNPRDCLYSIGTFSRRESGLVVDSSMPFKHAVPILDNIKIRSCINHWEKDVPWEKTGVYEHMDSLINERKSVDGCRCRDDVIQRYIELDNIFHTIKQEQRFRTRVEIIPKNFRERWGIYVHIDNTGKPMFGGGGCYRFAMALILNIPFPAEIGVVHKDAIPHLKKYRLEPCNNLFDTSKKPPVFSEVIERPSSEEKHTGQSVN